MVGAGGDVEERSRAEGVAEGVIELPKVVEDLFECAERGREGREGRGRGKKKEVSFFGMRERKRGGRKKVLVARSFFLLSLSSCCFLNRTS